MKSMSIFGLKFRNGRWEHCTPAMTTFEETLNVVKNHSVRDRFRLGNDTHLGVDFVVYRGQDGSALVEVYRDSHEPRTAAEFYKISAPLPGDNEESWVA